MRPHWWTKGDVTKLSMLTEEGRDLALKAVQDWFNVAGDMPQTNNEQLIAITYVIEALGGDV